MDHVLESERAAQDAVRHCRDECDHALEQARARRLEILDHAQARAMRLRQRVARALEPSTSSDEALAAAAVFDHTRYRAALEWLAAQLSGAAPERRTDEP